MCTVLSEPSTSTVAHGPVKVTVLPVPCTLAPSDPQAMVRRCDMPSTTGRWPSAATGARHSAATAAIVPTRISRRINAPFALAGDAPRAGNASA